MERSEKETSPIGADESDSSIWVFFSKEIGSEKMLVGFPKEPTYKYMSSDGSEMEITAASGGSEHRVFILGPAESLMNARKTSLVGAIVSHEKVDEEGMELIYWKGGYWFMERLISTDEHSYILQTKNADLESATHCIFVASFDLEKK